MCKLKFSTKGQPEARCFFGFGCATYVSGATQLQIFVVHPQSSGPGSNNCTKVQSLTLLSGLNVPRISNGFFGGSNR